MSRKRSTSGRPPIHADTATDRIYVRVTPAQRLELKRVASDNRTGVSGIIREAVNEFCGDYEERRPFVRTKP